MLLNETELQDLLNRMLGYEVRFCEEYMVDFNPQKALIRAKVPNANKPSANKALSATLLDKETVIQYLNHLKAKMGLETGVTAQRVLSEIAAIAFQDPRQMLVMDEKGEIRFRSFDDMPNTAAIKDIELASMTGDFRDMGKIIKMKTHDKLKALEMLGRHCALFTDNVNLTNNGKDLPDVAPVVKVIINHRAPGEPLGREQP